MNNLTNGELVYQKINLLIVFQTYPWLLIPFFLVLLFVLAFVAFARNPNLLNNLLTWKRGEIELPNGEVIKERRKNIRRQTDLAPCIISKCEKYEGLKDSLDKLTIEIIDLKNKDSKLEDHVDEIWISSLRRDFYSESCKLPEKILAGLTYVWWVDHKKIYNGRTKKDVTAMCFKHPDLYELAKKQNPKLIIDEVEKKYKISSLQ